MRDKKIVFRTPWFNIEKEYYKNLKAYGEKPFYRYNCPDSSVVLAVTPDNKIIFVKQFRPSIDKFTLELPSGAVDSGETPIKTAVRELYEETGYKCKKMRRIGMEFGFLDRINSKAFIFYGRDAVLDENFKPQEDIETELLSPAEVKRLALGRGESLRLEILSALLLIKWKKFDKKIAAAV